MIEAIILAAGKGTRMRSKLPKVMHTLGGKPLVERVMDTAQKIEAQKIHLVLGHGAEVVEQHFADLGVSCVMQHQQLGTGHAVMQAVPNLDKDSTVLILYGDVPLISPHTLNRLLQYVDDSAMALLTVTLYDPTGYGRIIRNDEGCVTAIVEEKDASPDQLHITEVNTGVMAVRAQDLINWLPLLSNENAQGEYYLTDLVEIAVQQSKRVNAVKAESEMEVMGVNNRAQQAQLERHLQKLIAEELMFSGTTILDPARFDCRGDLECGEDCVIDVNCVFEGEVTLGRDVVIGPNCIIKDSKIADGTHVNANSVIENAMVGENCVIGPFARVRPGSFFHEGVKIGNFVETKKAVIGKHSKVNHLSYIGDAHLGQNINVGAGTITCNYDGANKYKTVIGDGVFVGSNSALVAPLKLDEGATVAAGSTVTQNVGKQQLAVARQRQKNIDGWQRPTKK